MTELRFEKGVMLFAEGDESSYVLRLLSGEVDVVKGVGAQSVVLGRLGAGEFVGEMGVLENLPRSASVRAASDVVAERLDRESFLKLISADGEAAFHLMVRLSERLAAIDRAYVDAMATVADQSARFQPPAGEHAVAEPPRRTLTLFAGSTDLNSRMPATGCAIDRLPFVVGRAPQTGEKAPAIKAQLLLADREPFRLSRIHFWIGQADGDYRVRDRGSTLGTRVNGVSIGQHFARDSAPLNPGENAIVAGGEGSPFVFRAMVGG